MRTTSAQTQETWLSGAYTGSNRPMVRATIQRLTLQLSTYGNQTYSSVCFGQSSQPVELPNIQSVKWQRSVDQAVATMTMRLFNTEPLPLGSTPLASDGLDQPGYYTYQRGKAFYSPRWGHVKTGWQDWLVPDRIIRTYEGYGFNPNYGPEGDPNLYISGTWLIDDVDIDTEGYITLSCRDVGRVLLDQVALPPVIPTASYPLWFEKRALVNSPATTSASTNWVGMAYSDSSSTPWIGRNGNTFGHRAVDAFDTSNQTYWLSVGNQAPEEAYSFEWIEGKLPKTMPINAVSVTTWAGPYLAYVSVKSRSKGWIGTKTIPYGPNDPASFPNGGNVRYVATFTARREATTTFSFPAVADATHVRVTFTRLSNSGLGVYKYRAGVRSFKAASTTTVTVPGAKQYKPETTPPGVDDFTDVVKILLAYGGFHWPKERSRASVLESTGLLRTMGATYTDPALRSGRVWGDLENTGTMGVAPLGVDFFDKKPLMDIIKQIADMVGFIFFIDETGAAVFRSPNIWSVGNWIGTASVNAGRTNQALVIDESKVLMSLGARLSSRSIRERVFVGNLAGQVAGLSKGHNPYPSGLRRTSGWTDGRFATAKECQIMADMIALRQLFTYRTDRVKIPGNPAIQIDDQVRIYERITEEGYLHYVTGVSMEWDIESGRYTYDLSTHWLGDNAFSNWTFNPAKMSVEAQNYLKALGKIPS
jgi:hypothetical protein